MLFSKDCILIYKQVYHVSPRQNIGYTVQTFYRALAAAEQEVGQPDVYFSVMVLPLMHSPLLSTLEPEKICSWQHRMQYYYWPRGEYK